MSKESDAKSDDNNDENENTNNNDNNSANEQHQMSAMEAAILEMMKKQAEESASSQQSLTQVAHQVANERRHAFWDTQPMPHGRRNDHPEGPITPNRPIEEIRAEPYTMPAGFAWCHVDIHSESERDELYQLLANNYVEDDDCLFRFDYSQAFLLWALTPPGFRPDFLLGVRSTNPNKPKKLVAFISGVPAKVQAYQRTIPVVEINFLCVHKKLRSKRLAPVLIKEITRRVNRTGVFQAVYTAGVVLPVPISSARYHHRSLNPKKLVQVGFSRLSPRMTMARMIKLYKLPEKPICDGLRPMTMKDVPGVFSLLTKYLSKFHLKLLFESEDEVAHWLLPRTDVINSYVVQDDDGNITDFGSFYHLPSSILGKDDTLFAAYSYYNVATSMTLTELMKDLLVLAKTNGSDVFNALNLMDNEEFLEELKFGKGDGNLHYYLYNWACPDMTSSQVGIVLL